MAWKSCQMFGGQDKRSRLGATYCDLDCRYIAMNDKLLLCQIGIDESGEPVVNYIEIRRDDRSLFFETHIGAGGEAGGIICRPASHRNIKLSIKPETCRDGSYGRVRFIVYDPDLADINNAMYVKTYETPFLQKIDRIAIMLMPYHGYGPDYRPCGFPVGFNNLRSYGTERVPEKLKLNFEWREEEYDCGKGNRIVSRHSESYKLNTLVNVKQWKEKI
jgi:hypothetical protein